MLHMQALPALKWQEEVSAVSSSASDNGRIVARRFTEDLWDKGDLAVVDQILAPEFVDRDPVPGQGSGRDGYRNMVAAFRAAARHPQYPSSSDRRPRYRRAQTAVILTAGEP